MCMLNPLEYCYVTKNFVQPWDLTANTDTCAYYVHLIVHMQPPLILPVAYMGIGSTAIYMLKEWAET